VKVKEIPETVAWLGVALVAVGTLAAAVGTAAHKLTNRKRRTR